MWFLRSGAGLPASLSIHDICHCRGDPGWLLAFPAAQLIDLQSERYRAGTLGHELD
jgi:hypothetical protein